MDLIATPQASCNPAMEAKMAIQNSDCGECCEKKTVSVHVDTYITMVRGAKLVVMLPREAAGLFMQGDTVWGCIR